MHLLRLLVRWFSLERFHSEENLKSGEAGNAELVLIKFLHNGYRRPPDADHALEVIGGILLLFLVTSSLKAR